MIALPFAIKTHHKIISRISRTPPASTARPADWTTVSTTSWAFASSKPATSPGLPFAGFLNGAQEAPAAPSSGRRLDLVHIRRRGGPKCFIYFSRTWAAWMGTSLFPQIFVFFLGFQVIFQELPFS